MNNVKRIPDLIHSYWNTKSYNDTYMQGLKAAIAPFNIALLEMELLLALSHSPQSDSVTKLCAKIGKTKGVVSRACERLLKAGYITSTNDTKDRRVVHFQLTPASKTVIAAVAKHVETMSVNAPGFDESRDAFFDKKLTENLESTYLAILKINLKKATFRVLKQNEKFGKTLIPDAADVPGLISHWESLLHSDDKDEFTQTLGLAAMTNPKNGLALVSRFNINADYRWLEMRLDCFEDESNSDEAIITLRDIHFEITAFLTKTQYDSLQNFKESP